MKMPVIPMETFDRVMPQHLRAHYQRARNIFQLYGPRYSFEVATLLLWSGVCDGAQIERIISFLEKHHHECLEDGVPEAYLLIEELVTDPGEQVLSSAYQELLGSRLSKTALYKKHRAVF